MVINTQAGYIYVIKDESERRKLGYAEDVEIRLKQLQTGNAERLTIEYRLQVADMIRAETAIHNLFAAGRIRADGEWFHIADMRLLLKIFKAADTTAIEERQLIQLGLR